MKKVIALAGLLTLLLVSSAYALWGFFESKSGYVSQEGTIERDVENLVYEVWGNEVTGWKKKDLKRVVNIDANETPSEDGRTGVYVELFCDGAGSMDGRVNHVLGNSLAFLKKFFEAERFAQFKDCIFVVNMSGDGDPYLADTINLIFTFFPRELAEGESFKACLTPQDFYKFMKLNEEDIGFSLTTDFLRSAEKQFGK